MPRSLHGQRWDRQGLWTCSRSIDLWIGSPVAELLGPSTACGIGAPAMTFGPVGAGRQRRQWWVYKLAIGTHQR
jgi:hypothetical protein